MCGAAALIGVVPHLELAALDEDPINSIPWPIADAGDHHALVDRAIAVVVRLIADLCARRTGGAIKWRSISDRCISGIQIAQMGTGIVSPTEVWQGLLGVAPNATAVSYCRDRCSLGVALIDLHVGAPDAQQESAQRKAHGFGQSQDVCFVHGRALAKRRRDFNPVAIARHFTNVRFVRLAMPLCRRVAGRIRHTVTLTRAARGCRGSAGLSCASLLPSVPTGPLPSPRDWSTSIALGQIYVWGMVSLSLVWAPLRRGDRR
jgi:hypothetical protein